MSLSIEADMLYLKATAAGIVSGLLLATVWLLTALWLPVYFEVFLGWLRNEGGTGASSVGSGSVLLAAIIGFILGFYWTIHRSRSRRRENVA
jgi:hypothetical protein